MLAGNRKKIFAIAVLLLLGFGVYTAVQWRLHAPQAKLVFKVLPEDSLIKVDGSLINKNATYVRPGSHTVEASKTGFTTDKKLIKAQKGETKIILLLPAPASEEAFKWLEDHPDVQRQREGLASDEVAQTQELIQNSYKLLGDLPQVARFYRIDYGSSLKEPDNPRRFALYIKSTKSNRTLALDWIKYKGYDPKKFEIIYLNP